MCDSPCPSIPQIFEVSEKGEQDGGQTGKSIPLGEVGPSSRSPQKAARRGARGKCGSRGLPSPSTTPPPPCGLCPSSAASRRTDASREPGRSVTGSSLTAARGQEVAGGPGAPQVGTPRLLDPAGLLRSAPAPPTRPPQVGPPRPPGPAHPARLRWGGPARAANPARPAASGRVSSVPRGRWLRPRRRYKF